MKLSRFRPSPAMIVACVALVAAIGGSAYAASKINGKDIKSNTVTGKQVKESTLGTVDKAKVAKRAKKADTATSAESATTAESAGNADTLGGETRRGSEGSLAAAQRAGRDRGSVRRLHRNRRIRHQQQRLYRRRRVAGGQGTGRLDRDPEPGRHQRHGGGRSELRRRGSGEPLSDRRRGRVRSAEHRQRERPRGPAEQQRRNAIRSRGLGHVHEAGLRRRHRVDPEGCSRGLTSPAVGRGGWLSACALELGEDGGSSAATSPSSLTIASAS